MKKSTASAALYKLSQVGEALLTHNTRWAERVIGKNPARWLLLPLNMAVLLTLVEVRGVAYRLALADEKDIPCTAAGVLIRRGSRYLGFIRADNGMLGLPCGKTEKGETLRETAVRECYEEVGVFPYIKRDSEPYIAIDPVGGRKVACFAATIPLSEHPRGSDEGKPYWATEHELRSTGYHVYNRGALDFLYPDGEPRDSDLRRMWPT